MYWYTLSPKGRRAWKNSGMADDYNIDTLMFCKCQVDGETHLIYVNGTTGEILGGEDRNTDSYFTVANKPSKVTITRELYRDLWSFAIAGSFYERDLRNRIDMIATIV